MASPPTMLVSDSTHMPPTGTNCPSAIFFLIRSKSSGRWVLIQSSCCACDMAKTNSGCASIRLTMLDAVRETLRTVSRSGHSQAESMWAWPTALIRCAEALAGAASTPASRARAAAAVPGTSPGSTASRAASRARRISYRRASASPSCSMRSWRTSRSWTSSQTSVSKTARSIRASRYRGWSPLVCRSPSYVTQWSTRTGLEAASTYHSTCSPPAAESVTRTQSLYGLRALTSLPSARWTSPSHWKPGIIRSKPRSRTASTVRPAQSAGTVPVTLNQVVPQAGPHVSPIAQGPYGAARPSATGTGSPGASQRPISSGTGREWTAGLMRSLRTRRRRCSVMLRSSCMTAAPREGGFV